MRPLTKSGTGRNVTVSLRAVAAAAVTTVAMLGGTTGVTSASSIPQAVIQQGQPLTGTTVSGEAFSVNLQVSGGSGVVRYTQTAGAPNLTVSSAGQVTGAISLPVGSYSASGTDANKTGSGSWTFTLTVIAPAPPGFANTALQVYQSLYTLDQQQQGQAGTTQTPAQYQSQISQLSPDGLARYYNIVSQEPVWFQIPSMVQSISGTGTAASSKLIPQTKAGTSSTKALKVNPISAANSTDSVGPYSPNGNGGSYSDSACTSTTGSLVTTFVFQIIVDVASSVYNVAVASQIDYESFPDPVSKLIAENTGFAISLVAQGVVLVAQLIHDSASFTGQILSGCEYSDSLGYSANIDNTTVQTYNLVKAANSAIVQVQATATSTDQDVQTGVANVEGQLNSLQTSLGGQITQNAQAIESAIGSDSQGILSQLQTDTNGILSQLQSNNAAGATQSSLQQAAKDQVQAQVENVLLSTSSTAPVEMQLPAQDNGLLTGDNPNYFGVSVEQVALGALDLEDNAGTPPPMNIAEECSGAEDDISQSQWQGAFELFKHCYQDVTALP